LPAAASALLLYWWLVVNELLEDLHEEKRLDKEEAWEEALEDEVEDEGLELQCLVSSKRLEEETEHQKSIAFALPPTERRDLTLV